MGTNTKNCIRIFGITIRIYLYIHFGRSCLGRFGRSFLCPGNGHIRILVPIHDQFKVRKLWSGVSINDLELGSLYMSNCFFTIFNSRGRPSICKFKFRGVCVTCEMRCQHESIDSIVTTESKYFPTDSKILDFVHMTN